MAILNIVKYPDPRLREGTFLVDKIDENIRELVQNLIETMYSHHGAGIAANQVGRLERIFILDGYIFTPVKNEPVVFINPEIIEKSKDTERLREGCLSFPNIFAEINRPKQVRIRAINLQGENFEMIGTGIIGRALQHEYDHLTGRLMIDLVGFLKKEEIKRKAKHWNSSK